MTDTKCSIQNQALNHYLCHGLPQDFLIDAGNNWDPHPVNLDVRYVGVVSSNYIVLAESSRAPVIAIHKHSVATQFCLHKIYRESVMLFSNFFKHLVTSGHRGLNYDLALQKQVAHKGVPKDPRVSS
jgi:hypothetical protein